SEHAGEQRRLRAVGEPGGKPLVEEPVPARQPPPARPGERRGEQAVRGAEAQRDDGDLAPRPTWRPSRGGREGVGRARQEHGEEIAHRQSEADAREHELPAMVAGRVGHGALYPLPAKRKSATMNANSSHEEPPCSSPSKRSSSVSATRATSRAAGSRPSCFSPPAWAGRCSSKG